MGQSKGCATSKLFEKKEFLWEVPPTNANQRRYFLGGKKNFSAQLRLDHKELPLATF